MTDEQIAELQYEAGMYQSLYENANAEVARLRNILRAPLSSAELKLVDKNCAWVPFRHAWNAIIKARLNQLTTNIGSGSV